MKTTNRIKQNLGKLLLLLVAMMMVFAVPTYSHCDSYDGPVIQDAMIALDQEEVGFVMKWIANEHEKEITELFDKTVALKNQDEEIYSIVEKHFLETLVRYHRETEGAAYTGLKPAGSTTPIVQMADQSIERKEVETLLNNLSNHIQATLTEKYDKVAALSEVKDRSIEEGRAYVAAYVDYTHTLEAIEAVLAHGGHH